MLYGYARVSTIDRDLSIQKAALTAAGCAIIRDEKVFGTSTEGREELKTLLQFLREGDTLVVTRIDRLAPSLRDLQNIVHELRQLRGRPEGDRAVNRHQLRGREVLCRHARRLCRIRDERATRAPA